MTTPTVNVFEIEKQFSETIATAEYYIPESNGELKPEIYAFLGYILPEDLSFVDLSANAKEKFLLTLTLYLKYHGSVPPLGHEDYYLAFNHTDEETLQLEFKGHKLIFSAQLFTSPGKGRLDGVHLNECVEEIRASNFNTTNKVDIYKAKYWKYIAFMVDFFGENYEKIVYIANE